MAGARSDHRVLRDQQRAPGSRAGDYTNCPRRVAGILQVHGRGKDRRAVFRAGPHQPGRRAGRRRGRRAGPFEKRPGEVQRHSPGDV